MLGPKKETCSSYDASMLKDDIKREISTVGYLLSKNFYIDNGTKISCKSLNMILYMKSGRIDSVSASGLEVDICSSEYKKRNNSFQNNFDLEWVDQLHDLKFVYSKIYINVFNYSISVVGHCPVCLKSNKMKFTSFTETYDNIKNKDVCCSMVLNKSINKTITRRIDENSDRTVLINRYTGKCKFNHKFNVSQSAFYRYSDDNYNNIECTICELIPKFKFFDIIRDLNMIIAIEETFSNITKGNKDKRLLSKLEILVYNKSNHVIGKIVFDDYNGEKQAKSNRNNVEFAWMETRYIDDHQYCLSFLNIFHKRILERYNLKGE